MGTILCVSDSMMQCKPFYITPTTLFEELITQVRHHVSLGPGGFTPKLATYFL